MAHLVEQMAYVGATPWHGLGSRLSPKQPLEVWQREAGMDWQIQESPVHFKSDAIGHLGSIHTFPEQKVLYRSDTKAPLSVVALARGVLLERRLQFIGYTDVAHHQAALLVLEYAVDPGQWPVSGCGLHRFVHVQGVHAGRIESFLSRTITRLSGSSVHEKRWHHCLKGTFF